MRAARLILIILLLAGAVMACITGGGGGGDDDTPTWQRSINATCTYGAEQWHAQLTALATGEP